MTRLLTTLSFTLAVLIGSTGVCYALPECEGSPTTDNKVMSGWRSCSGEFTDKRGGHKFTGRFEYGIRSGNFTVVHTSGHKYVGEWYGFMPNGHGTEILPDGSTYTGQFKNGRKNGYGTYNWVSPNKNSTTAKYVG